MNDREDLLLLVEDDENLRRLLSMQLKKLGFASHYAVNGRQAADMVKQHAYSLVLMDIMMPETDGCTAARQIRDWEQSQGKPRVPIIAMTAYEEREQCLAAGMDDYLAKPILLDTLRQAIGRFIPVVGI
jgi:CheY-like chemotaxis protein